MLSPRATPCRAERTAFRVIAGEALVMVIDRRELHQLNKVGARVFELCDGATSLTGIVAAIVREFEIDPENAYLDVEGFVTDLGVAGALQLDLGSR
jgi:hypothetical protein